jgi:hypothetical protein
MVYGVLTPLSIIFQLYATVSFIGRVPGGKPPTCRKSLTYFTTYYNVVSSTPHHDQD